MCGEDPVTVIGAGRTDAGVHARAMVCNALLDTDLSEEEILENRRRKFRIAAGVGDLAATLFGVGAILALLAFLMSMLQFISSDIAQSLSLWQIKF